MSDPTPEMIAAAMAEPSFADTKLRTEVEGTKVVWGWCGNKAVPFLPGFHFATLDAANDYEDWVQRERAERRAIAHRTDTADQFEEANIKTQGHSMSDEVNRWWRDLRGKSVDDVLRLFANTDCCINDAEYERAECRTAAEIVAALSDAGFEIVPLKKDAP